jgi:hypothetical protein
MSGQLSWYDILDILPGSSVDEVQRAFASKARVLRPDLISGAPSKVVVAAGRALTAVETARNVLTDPVARRRYDVEIGIRKTGGGLAGPERVPSETGPDPGDWTGTLPVDPDALVDVLGALADWLVPRPAPPRRIAVPDVRGLFVGPCRRFIAATGMQLDIIRLTADPMPVEGLVVGQAPSPGATARRSSTLTVQVWHPPRQRTPGIDDKASPRRTPHA